MAIEPLTKDLRYPKWSLNKSHPTEDRSYIQFLTSHIIVPKSRKKVFIDFGLNTFESSVAWFWNNYPQYQEFDEIHGFEVNPNIFKIPSGWTKKIEKKFHYYNTFVDVKGKLNINLCIFDFSNT